MTDLETPNNETKLLAQCMDEYIDFKKNDKMSNQEVVRAQELAMQKLQQLIPETIRNALQVSVSAWKTLANSVTQGALKAAHAQESPIDFGSFITPIATYLLELHRHTSANTQGESGAIQEISDDVSGRANSV